MDGDFCGGASCDGGCVKLGTRGRALLRGVPRGDRCVGGRTESRRPNCCAGSRSTHAWGGRLAAGRRGLLCCCRKLQPWTSPCSERHCLGEERGSGSRRWGTFPSRHAWRTGGTLTLGWKRGDAGGLSAWLLACPSVANGVGEHPGFCWGSLWPEAGFLPLWISVMAGVTPGCLSVYAVYFIKELEQSRQDFSSCLSSVWSH